MMRKIMDVNPFKIHEGGLIEEEKVSRFKKLRSICAACYPSTLKNWIIFILALIILWQFLVAWGIMPSLTFPVIDSDKWQAVFLTNNQAYFGHLKELNKDYVKLSDIYYLKTSQQSPSAQQQLNLVKFIDEIHGPENDMFISKEQITFWENLRNDSAVVLTINQAEKK